MAAKLLEGRSRKGGDSAELLHRTWNAGNNNNKGAADPSPPNRTAQFGPLQAPTLNVNSLPLATRGKPPSISGTLYRRQSSSTRNLIGYQGEVTQHHATGAAAAAVSPNTQGPVVPSSKGTALHVKRRSDTSHRHLAQVSSRWKGLDPTWLLGVFV